MILHTEDDVANAIDAVKHPNPIQLVMQLTRAAFITDVEEDVIARIASTAFEYDIPDDAIDAYFVVLKRVSYDKLCFGNHRIRPSMYSKLKKGLSTGSGIAVGAFLTLFRTGCLTDAQLKVLSALVKNNETNSVFADAWRQMKGCKVRFLKRALDAGHEALGEHYGTYLRRLDVIFAIFALKEFHDAAVEEFEYSNPSLVHLARGRCALAIAHDCKSVEATSKHDFGGILENLCSSDRVGFRRFQRDALASITSPIALCSAAIGSPADVKDNCDLLLATVAQYSEKTEQATLCKAVQAMSRHAWRLGSGLELPATHVGRALSCVLRGSDARGCAEDVASFCLKNVEAGPGFVFYGLGLRTQATFDDPPSMQSDPIGWDAIDYQGFD